MMEPAVRLFVAKHNPPGFGQGTNDRAEVGVTVECREVLPWHRRAGLMVICLPHFIFYVEILS